MDSSSIGERMNTDATTETVKFLRILEVLIDKGLLENEIISFAHFHNLSSNQLFKEPDLLIQMLKAKKVPTKSHKSILKKIREILDEQI